MAPLPETASYQVCHHSVPPHNCFLFTATFATFVVHLLQHCTQCSSTALQCGVVHWCGTGALCSCTSSLLQYTAMWCALWCAAELYRYTLSRYTILHCISRTAIQYRFQQGGIRKSAIVCDLTLFHLGQGGAIRGKQLIDTLKSDHKFGWFLVSESCKSFRLTSISVRYEVSTQLEPPIHKLLLQICPSPLPE